MIFHCVTWICLWHLTSKPRKIPKRLSWDLVLNFIHTEIATRRYLVLRLNSRYFLLGFSNRRCHIQPAFAIIEQRYWKTYKKNLFAVWINYLVRFRINASCSFHRDRRSIRDGSRSIVFRIAWTILYKPNTNQIIKIDALSLSVSGRSIAPCAEGGKQPASKDYDLE